MGQSKKERANAAKKRAEADAKLKKAIRERKAAMVAPKIKAK